MLRSSEFDYDLVVIGSGPGGQRAAIQAAKLDKRVALVEKKAVVGGRALIPERFRARPCARR